MPDVTPASADAPELSVVMPVYNEAAVIAGVLREWVDALDRLDVDFELRVYDDGSRDATAEILDRAAAGEPRMVPVHQPNRGHGPAILRGYREARGGWIFQVDGDGELPADGFAELWRRRQGFDLLMGWRRDRRAPAGRRLLTALSRWSVRLLFGAGIRDVNTPYRLWRRAVLTELLPQVPADAFAPNVVLSGLALRAGVRIHQRPVDFRPRRGSGATTSARLLRGALRSFRELAAAAWSGR